MTLIIYFRPLVGVVYIITPFITIGSGSTLYFDAKMDGHKVSC